MRDPVLEMGELLEPGAWCRQRWCRADPAAEHFDGDGCSCHEETAPAAGETRLESNEPERADPAPEPPRLAPSEPRLTILTPKAARLAAFACRACGRNTRRMIEAPALFFRCEDCARADRWPPSTRRHA